MNDLRYLSVVFVMVLAVGKYVSGKSITTEWEIKGGWIDACCCNVSCPCLFGGKPTEGFCQGASLVEIHSGHYNDVKLDGLTVVATYHIGKWGKLHIDPEATKEQVAALKAVMPEAIPFLGLAEIKTVETVPVKVVRKDGLIKYSVPATTVEMEPILGHTGKPMKIDNFPVLGGPFPASHDHIQHKSKKLAHEADGDKFEWTGRNAYTSKLDISSERTDS